MRPTLIQAMIATPKSVPYFDLSFQHTSPTVLRRMRRFGDNEKFLHQFIKLEFFHQRLE
jgi:tRNA A37 methylthiotransferase MiaB